MSSTNKTTNYELSQFLGTDKPAWLADYNTDMSKIDTQMKANADASSVADGKAVTNATAIGTIANLTTEAKTNLVSAVNEVDSHADTAQNSANSANTAIDALSTYLNLNTFQKIQSPTTSNGTLGVHDIYVARNSAGTICKIYGYVGLTNLNASTVTITLPNSGLSTSEDITVQGLGIFQGDQTKTIVNLTTTIKTTGSVEISFTRPTNDTSGFARAFACLVFVKNFGDLPE